MMTERYTLYRHDGNGNLKMTAIEVMLPRSGVGRSDERAIAEALAMTDPHSFYTFVSDDGRKTFSAGPVGWRSKVGERVPEWKVA